MDNVVAEKFRCNDYITSLILVYQRQVNTSVTDGKSSTFLPVQTFMLQMRETKTLDFTLAAMQIPIWT